MSVHTDRTLLKQYHYNSNKWIFYWFYFPDAYTPRNFIIIINFPETQCWLTKTTTRRLSSHHPRIWIWKLIMSKHITVISQTLTYGNPRIFIPLCCMLVILWGFNGWNGKGNFLQFINVFRRHVCVCVYRGRTYKHEYIIIISLIIYDFHMRYKMIHNQSTLLLLLLNIRIGRGVVAAKKDRILLYDIKTRNHYVFLIVLFMFILDPV